MRLRQNRIGKMRILCVLQNAWGDRQLPIVFCPNPFNKSAKVVRKMVGDNYYDFSNTTDVVTSSPKGKPSPNYEHFRKVMEMMPKYDLILVCGKQAEETVRKFQDEIRQIGKPIIFVPHPAARNLTNKRVAKINRVIQIVNKKWESIKSK